MAQIIRLSPETITRIAAGEVVNSAKAAVKELVENSIDASADKIDVTLRGNKLLESIEITDNGKGIHPSDFPLLCEKHATSKIETFEDLKSIGSMGFRGEALASISYVANVHVMSSQNDSGIGYEAQFLNGSLLETRSKPVTVCSHKKGTTIRVTNFFYNLESRRKECNLEAEARKISNMISKMAVHYSNIEFFFSSFNGSSKEQRKSISIKKKPLMSKETDVPEYRKKASLAYKLFAKSIDSEEDLLEHSCSLKSSGVEIKGLFLKPNSKFSGKKIVLFVNDRIVKNRSLKSAIEKAYNQVILGIYGSKVSYFVYLEVIVRKELLDVNVHPNKKLVQFIGEEEVAHIFQENLMGFLKDCVNAREYKAVKMYQTAFVRSQNELGLMSAKSSKGLQENKTPNCSQDYILKEKCATQQESFSSNFRLKNDAMFGKPSSSYNFPGSQLVFSSVLTSGPPSKLGKTAQNTISNISSATGSDFMQYSRTMIRKDPTEQKLEHLMGSQRHLDKIELDSDIQKALIDLQKEYGEETSKTDALEFVRQGVFAGSVHPLIIFVQYFKHLIRMDMLESMRDFFYFYLLKNAGSLQRSTIDSGNEEIGILLGKKSPKIIPFLQRHCMKMLANVFGFEFSFEKDSFFLHSFPQIFPEMSLSSKQWADFLTRLAVHTRNQLSQAKKTSETVWSPYLKEIIQDNEQESSLNGTNGLASYSTAMILEKFPPSFDPGLHKKVQKEQEPPFTQASLIPTTTKMLIENQCKSHEADDNERLGDKEILQIICTELSDALVLSLNQKYPEIDVKKFSESQDEEKYKRLYEECIFPLVKRWGLRGKMDFNGQAESILDLDKIYSIFERC